MFSYLPHWCESVWKLKYVQMLSPLNKFFNIRDQHHHRLCVFVCMLFFWLMIATVLNGKCRLIDVCCRFSDGIKTCVDQNKSDPIISMTAPKWTNISIWSICIEIIIMQKLCSRTDKRKLKRINWLKISIASKKERRKKKLKIAR